VPPYGYDIITVSVSYTKEQVRYENKATLSLLETAENLQKNRRRDTEIH
jgi:hypothetical protein